MENHYQLEEIREGSGRSVISMKLHLYFNSFTPNSIFFNHITAFPYSSWHFRGLSHFAYIKWVGWTWELESIPSVIECYNSLLLPPPLNTEFPSSRSSLQTCSFIYKLLLSSHLHSRCDLPSEVLFITALTIVCLFWYQELVPNILPHAC